MKADGTPARILVIGDIIIDHDIYLTSVRQSPEGVPIVAYKNESIRLGGAGAVATMAERLGAYVTLIGVTGEYGKFGNDPTLFNISQNISEVQAVSDYRYQTVRTRTFVDGKQIFRQDQDGDDGLADEQYVREKLLLGMPDPSEIDVVLIADYAKGVITSPLMVEIYQRYYDKPIIIDPHVRGDWSAYELATCLTPNRDEYRDCFPFPPFTEWVVRKLGAGGLILYEKHSVGWPATASHIDFPATQQPDQIIDPCGAGDMVLAALGVFIAEGRLWPDAARLANKAAGLKCLRRGAVPVERELVMSDEWEPVTC